MRRINNDLAAQMPILVDDFDDDGDLDMAVPSTRSDIISIFEGDWDGRDQLLAYASGYYSWYWITDDVS